jgi:hypothetical protein
LPGKKYLKAAQLVIDDVGLQPLSRVEANLSFGSSRTATSAAARS